MIELGVKPDPMKVQSTSPELNPGAGSLASLMSLDSGSARCTGHLSGM